MTKQFSSLFTYEDIEEYELDLFMVNNAEFLLDFGPWKKGEKVDSLGISFTLCEFKSYDDGGNVISFCSFVLQAT